jgi:hypothetical protein
MVAAAVLSTLASRTLAEETSDTDLYTHFKVAWMVDFFPDVLDRVGDRLDLRVVALALVTSTAVLLRVGRQMGGQLVASYLGAPAFAMGWTFLFAGNGWVVSNSLHPRYFFPLYAAGLLLVVGAVTEVVEVAMERAVPHLRARSLRSSGAGAGAEAGAGEVPRRLALAGSLLTVAIVPAAVWAIRRVPVDELTRAQPQVAAAEEHDVELVVGDYWRVWPTVFAGRAQGIELEGVAARSDPVRSRILGKLEAQLAQDGVVRVVCTEGSPSRCVEHMVATTGRGWELDDVLDRRPLVLVLTPAAMA